MVADIFTHQLRNLGDCNWIRTHNNLICKRALRDLG